MKAGYWDFIDDQWEWVEVDIIDGKVTVPLHVLNEVAIYDDLPSGPTGLIDNPDFEMNSDAWKS